MQNDSQLSAEPVKSGGFLSSFWLKLFAIIAMTCDHVAAGFPIWNTNFDLYWIMRFIGRMTFPIMAFLLVEGFLHTHDIRKYATRLLTFAILSIAPFYLFFHSYTGEQINNIFDFLRIYLLNNVLFTLLIGLIMLYFVKKINNFFLELLVVIAAMFLSSLSDWGVIGPLIIYIFYKVKNRWIAGFINYIVFIIHGFIIPLYDHYVRGGSLAVSNNIPWLSVNFGFVLAILVIGLYNGKRGLNNNFVKWGYYLYYPVHLMILYFIRLYLWKS